MMVTGTVQRLRGNFMFIARDDGVIPDVYLHVSVARQGGLVEPYDGQRVRCEITRDGVGNVTALEVAPLSAGRTVLPERSGPVPVNLTVSPEEIGWLIERGRLAKAERADPSAVTRAVVGLLRELRPLSGGGGPAQAA